MFETLLMVHIIAGFICLVSGLFAMFSRKRNGVHTVSGEVYHGAFVLIFLTSVVMAVMQWESSAYLFFIGIFSYSFALVGYVAGKRKKKGWIIRHIGGMLGSYIAVVTAVIVVNVHKVPFLNELPVLLFWFLPTIIGTPLIRLVGKKYAPKPRRTNSNRAV